MLQTYAVHVEDTTRYNRDCLAIGVQIPSRDGEIKGQI